MLRLVEALGRAAAFDRWGWPIVIHCNSGVHRAPSLALAILVRLKGLPEASRSRLRGRSAVGSIDLHSVLQAWHLWNWAGSVARLVPVCRRGSLCGRRGNRKHRPPFCVAGVALGDINLPFVWQAWHLHASTSILYGRRGTWRHQPSRCVAGVAFMAPWLFVCLA